MMAITMVAFPARQFCRPQRLHVRGTDIWRLCTPPMHAWSNDIGGWTQSVAHALVTSGVIDHLCQNLSRLEFEARKDGAMVFNNVLRKRHGSALVAVDYLNRNTHLLDSLLLGYHDAEAAMCTGNMLRECTRCEPLCRRILDSKHFDLFFVFIELPTFEVATDAFSTFRELFTRYTKEVTSPWLTANYDKFFQPYTSLLQSTNYVTRRQSLKLLGELLLDRENVQVMMKFINDPNNLKLMMNLLRDSSRSIQIEAFHIFKVFVANPAKPKAVSDILCRNRDKLILFLTDFNPDKDNEQFAEDKEVILKEIKDLPRV